MASHATVRRLRAGIVPLEDLELLSVGYGGVRDLVQTRLAALSSALHAQPLFVKGEWGSGKSHLLSFIRASAVAAPIPVSLIDLNDRSAALNYPQRLYPVLAENLRCDGDALGLREVVLRWLEDSDQRGRLAGAARKAPGHLLSWSLQCLVTRHEGGDNVAIEDCGDWSILLGADLRWASYGYKRDLALERMDTLAGIFHGLGMGGLTLVFDEAETIDQLWNVRSRLTAYGVLGRLCRMKHVWCVFGITARFERVLSYDNARGFTDSPLASPDARWFLKAWSDGSLDIVAPPEVTVEHARSLATSIAQLYSEAYGKDGADNRLVHQCVESWLKNPSRNPRQLIRLLVHQLDIRRPL